MIALSEPYQPRPTRFLGLWQLENWRMKAYGISYGDTVLSAELVQRARDIAVARLAESAEQTAHYGVGFVGIHQGKTSNFVFVDWWASENELHHHVYVSPSADSMELVYQTPSGLAACVWDLLVIAHERDAWVKHVLKHDGGPDLEVYLSDRFHVPG